MNDNFQQSKIDLKDDFGELIFLCGSQTKKLINFLNELESARNYIQKKTYSSIFKKTKELIEELENAEKEAKLCFKSGLGRNDSYIFEAKKRELYDLYRTLQILSASLITSTDWQSPSYLSAVYSNAGRETNKIKGNINDYKRDVHLDEGIYEKKFLKEYIEAKFKFTKFAYLTSSGMAACSLVLNGLIMEGKIKGKILLGKSVYFQNKQIIKNLFKENSLEIDEENTDEILKYILKYNPSAIFLDTLSVTKNIAVPDIPGIISFLQNEYKKDIYLILDNTCLASSFQPFKLIRPLSNIKLILLESLNKYHQFGTDRVTAGIVICSIKEAPIFYEYRKHLGVNISDLSVHCLPNPSRKMLMRRLLRLGRNAFYLSSEIENFVKKNCTILKRVVFPGLLTHPSFNFVRDRKFNGSFFNLIFEDKYENKKFFQKFIDRIISDAKRNKIDINACTSFGLNTTRIYMTASYTNFTHTFIRISAGTENMRQAEEIKELLIRNILR